MFRKNGAKKIVELLSRLRVTAGHKFTLADYATDDPFDGQIDKEEAKDLLQQGIDRLAAHQDLLYATGRYAVLIILQGMDAAGKDGTIKHVMSGINPQGVRVSSFREPSAEELAHDFLWRTHKAMPQKGMIGIFNRSYYEDVLITRVHQELLKPQKLPDGPHNSGSFWRHRLEDIAQFESYLSRQGVLIMKFFLHLSKEEQKRRLLERLEQTPKNWKFSMSDVRERAQWDAYMDAYTRAIAATATPLAPWYVLPADQKWLTRLMVVEAICAAITDLNLKPMTAPPEVIATLGEARAMLEAEK
ncbi:polyphosphate kinase 2 family protein [Methylovirgula sp. 4M-Z18]|uniref:polyphosphate kinase 2 family protein n=1 Tax=Methylovirgula sp. 4M-Z18 TaxID=2293567 RepID=UPI000E2F1B1A|nr:polyphosphate kinase 2 family protein [Methylovirgula sp. 4M-Z18]RFB78349.1 polyphosphate kinase 2 family protein [Methylovirgula sp. 4M-Z18]